MPYDATGNKRYRNKTLLFASFQTAHLTQQPGGQHPCAFCPIIGYSATCLNVLLRKTAMIRFDFWWKCYKNDGATHSCFPLAQHGKRTHMVRTEENTLHVPRVCLAFSVMKERKHAGWWWRCLVSLRETGGWLHRWWSKSTHTKRLVFNLRKRMLMNKMHLLIWEKPQLRL